MKQQENIMETINRQMKRITFLPTALESGLDEAVEFRVPQQSSLHCFFALDGSADLIVVMDDCVSGETEHLVNFDNVVESLLQTFTEQPPGTIREKMEDIASLRTLAVRFQSVAARLVQEAGKREREFPRADSPVN